MKVKSTKPGTVYVVPNGTPQDKGQIELAAVGSTVVSAADEAATILFVPEETRLRERESYLMYAVDRNNGLVSLPSASVFTVDREAPIFDQADIKEAGWQDGEDMNEARYGGASAVLSDGDVLVVGGNILKTGERYDVKREKWSTIAEMNVARYGPAAALLPDGRVLVVGGDPSGNPNNLLKSTEIYDPESDSWEPGASMTIERFKPVAVSLEDGRVLVTGGMSKRGYLKSAEIYDPETNEWTKAADMQVAREGLAATVLNDGRVLVVGGGSTGFLDSAELYNPEADEWTLVSNMPEERYKSVAVTLENGKALVAGGYRVNTALMYDSEKDVWEETTSLPANRFEAMGGLLPDGRVLLAGGYDGRNEKTSTLIYSPQLSVEIPFQEDVVLLGDQDELIDMLSYSIDGGSYLSLRDEDRLSFSTNKLRIVLDLLPKGTSIQFKLDEGAFVDAAGNQNEELISDSYRYIP
ncbi:Kelch repeat-containing protein [Brevibacillus sp. NRS-1366]|uniref:Kelch repeat-containing protein n=1 Tax=Brevibacillus sp. NRS-1366 TaxID=3233899 RepID=UPI003D1D4B6B